MATNGTDRTWTWCYGILPWGECIFHLGASLAVDPPGYIFIRYIVQILRAQNGQTMFRYVSGPDFVQANVPIQIMSDKLAAYAPASEEAVAEVCKLCGLTRIAKPTAKEAKNILEGPFPRIKIP
jgi:hypothetical protein